MRVSEAARRYAQALYDLAKNNSKADRIFLELRVLKQVFESDKAIHEFLLSPLVAPDLKLKVLHNTFAGKTSDELTNILMLLAEKNRLPLFLEIATAFEDISDEDHGVTRGTVRSATALLPAARKQIEEIVNQVTKKKVILNFTEDSKLLGGMVAQVGGWTFDDSLESHLTRMGEELNRRAN